MFYISYYCSKAVNSYTFVQRRMYICDIDMFIPQFKSNKTQNPNKNTWYHKSFYTRINEMIL